MTFLKSKHTNQFLKEHLIIYQRVKQKISENNKKKNNKQLAIEIIELNEYFINQLVKNGYPYHHPEIQILINHIEIISKFI